MKAGFDATCDGCEQFEPHCATVYMRVLNRATLFETNPTTPGTGGARRQLHESTKATSRKDGSHGL